MSDPNINWSEQQVIVTGGAGFLGSHLVAHLQSQSVGELIVPRSADYDLREKAAVQQLFADYPDATMIIHLAATVGGIGANREHPAQFFYDNIMMGTLLIEHAYQSGISKFVNIGTICEYPKITPVPFKEADLWNGYPEETNAPYGIAKKALLVMGNAYRQEYGFNVIHLLPTNLYGPGDNFDPRTAHVIPDMIRKMIIAQENGDAYITLFGDGTPTREFLYVKDAAAGIALAAARYDKPDPVNLGSGYEISIKDLAETIARTVEFSGELRWDTSKPNGQPRRQVDSSLAEQAFGFRASTSFDEGLAEVVAWYRQQRDMMPASS